MRVTLIALFLVAAPALADSTPPKPATPAAAGDGFLAIYSLPYAKVILDGKDTGRMTPIDEKHKLALSPGTHTIELTATGARNAKFTAVIRAGELSVIRRELEAATAGAGPTMQLAIDRSGALTVDGRPMSEAQLIDYLKEMEWQVVIAADRDLPYKKVVHVIDLLKSHGVRKFSLAVGPQDRTGK